MPSPAAAQGQAVASDLLGTLLATIDSPTRIASPPASAMSYCDRILREASVALRNFSPDGVGVFTRPGSTRIPRMRR